MQQRLGGSDAIQRWTEEEATGWSKSSKRKSKSEKVKRKCKRKKDRGTNKRGEYKPISMGRKRWWETEESWREQGYHLFDIPISLSGSDSVEILLDSWLRRRREKVSNKVREVKAFKKKVSQWRKRPNHSRYLRAFYSLLYRCCLHMAWRRGLEGSSRTAIQSNKTNPKRFWGKREGEEWSLAVDSTERDWCWCSRKLTCCAKPRKSTLLCLRIRKHLVEFWNSKPWKPVTPEREEIWSGVSFDSPHHRLSTLSNSDRLLTMYLTE